jgi:hypothetical protein
MNGKIGVILLGSLVVALVVGRSKSVVIVPLLLAFAVGLTLLSAPDAGWQILAFCGFLVLLLFPFGIMWAMTQRHLLEQSENGNAEAQFQRGLSHFGRYADGNVVEGAKWILLAARQGYKPAETEWLNLEKKLTAPDREAAHQQATLWSDNHSRSLGSAPRRD